MSDWMNISPKGLESWAQSVPAEERDYYYIGYEDGRLQPPRFLGLADDGRAAFNDPEIGRNQISLFTLDEIRMGLQNLPALLEYFGPRYQVAVKRAFENARWAINMGAKPSRHLAELVASKKYTLVL